MINEKIMYMLCLCVYMTMKYNIQHCIDQTIPDLFKLLWFDWICVSDLHDITQYIYPLIYPYVLIDDRDYFAL